MPESLDQIGRNVNLARIPNRIVSLVPSQTELLYDLGLDSEVIGITKFCIHPPGWIKKKVVVGGTKNANLEMIKALNPDLVIANKEENTQDKINQIASFCPVWVSNVHDIGSALDMIKAIGGLVGREREANGISKRIREGFTSMNIRRVRNAVYLIWKKPFMAAGSDTFIHSMMEASGYRNLVQLHRYPVLHVEALKALKPEVVLLSSEPYPFKKDHVIELEQLFGCEVKLVDGEMYSWHGSRMLKALEYFKKEGGTPAVPPV